jgi:hypothetical protein
MIRTSRYRLYNAAAHTHSTHSPPPRASEGVPSSGEVSPPTTSEDALAPPDANDDSAGNPPSRD